MDAVREVARSGVTLEDVEYPAIVRAFLGPTDEQELEGLPALSEAEGREAGSTYGEHWRTPLSHEARASVGVRLALLCDRRAGVGLRPDRLPDIAWCRVEGQAVTIPFQNQFGLYPLARWVDAFWIARYPVTIDQFQSFLDDCYRDHRWLLPPHYLPPRYHGRYGNYPADSVSWWDAMYFCHWLGIRLGTEGRLPTELEWQLAATGGDPERVYPWGRVWAPAQEPWRANTIESDLNHSTAVGLYPAGASPVGAEDMAGTIWEWCLNGMALT